MTRSRPMTESADRQGGGRRSSPGPAAWPVGLGRARSWTFMAPTQHTGKEMGGREDAVFGVSVRALARAPMNNRAKRPPPTPIRPRQARTEGRHPARSTYAGAMEDAPRRASHPSRRQVVITSRMRKDRL
jgi:hypothetical protein